MREDDNKLNDWESWKSEMFSKCYILCKDVSVDEAVFALYSQPRSGMLCSVVAFLCTFVTVLSNDGAAWWLSVNQDAYETDLITKKKSGIIQLFYCRYWINIAKLCLRLIFYYTICYWRQPLLHISFQVDCGQCEWWREMWHPSLYLQIWHVERSVPSLGCFAVKRQDWSCLA